MVDEAQVRAALARVVDPATGKDIVAADQVKALRVEGGEVSFVLEVDPARGPAAQPLLEAARAAVEALPGVERVRAVMTAHNPHGGPQGAASPQAPARGPAPNLRGGGPAPQPRRPAGPAKLEGVGRIIAVASGKGGVGKSTLAANLAVALAARGRRVGLLDADVYGPSQPRMLGITGKPASPDGKTILPLRGHGVTVMSLGFMAPEGEAIAWRGPMLMGALQQMLTQVQWGQLDDLIVDLPPGTGDVQMTLCQKFEVAGAVVVSTPQDIALIDARKGIDMFRKLDVAILGIVENMAGFVCDECGKTHYPFGHGGAREEAEKLGVPFLGEVPLDLAIRVAGDCGAPIVISSPESPEAQAFWRIADQLIEAEAKAGA